MRAAVGEEEVDNHTQNGEDEDTHGPQQLVGDGSAGLDYLD
jgi:hypothetical protein